MCGVSILLVSPLAALSFINSLTFVLRLVALAGLGHFPRGGDRLEEAQVIAAVAAAARPRGGARGGVQVVAFFQLLQPVELAFVFGHI